MARTITNHEMDRRKAIAAAQSGITDEMAKHALTPLEWCRVLNELQARMIGHGLVEEWSDDDAE